MRFSLIAAASLTCACVYIPSDPMLDDVRTDSGVVISRDIGGCGVPGAFDDGTVRYLRITIRDANGRRQNPVFKYGKSFLSAAQLSDVFTTIMLFDHEFRDACARTDSTGREHVRDWMAYHIAGLKMTIDWLVSYEKVNNLQEHDAAIKDAHLKFADLMMMRPVENN